ncbi:MAG: enoyl-CoA hydratase/isomerase family protein [Xanthobacteraceae bacterium]
MTDAVRVTLAADDIFEITLAAPEHGNALDAAMADVMLQALRDLPEKAKAILLTAEGADFCAGRRGDMPQGAGKLTAIDIRKKVIEPVLDLYQALRNAPVPILAAVHGRATGVGCALAGLADVAIAAEDAQFTIPEMNHDIPPTLVMTALVERMPRNHLARLVITRDAINGREAQALGIVSMVAPAAKLAEEIARIRKTIGANTAPVLRAVKAFLTASSETSFATRRDYAAMVNAAAMAERFR